MLKSRTLFHSLQFQLIFWSVVSLLLLAIIAGGYGFWYSYNEINDFQDDNLKNTAALLEQSFDINGLNTNAAALDDDYSSHGIHFDTDDDDGAITVDIVMLSAPDYDELPDHHNNEYHSDERHSDHDDDHDHSNPIPLAIIDNIPKGISDQNIDGHSWRTYRDDVEIKSLDADEKVALILRQQTDLQDDLAKASALQSSLPLIIGIGLLILLLPFITWRMMTSVRQLHHEISTRNENDLSPLQIDKLPSELLPLAHSLNRLLALVKVSIERQQRFIADAAHELRSPLTAISLQLQRLQRMTDDKVMSEGLDKLAIRLKRNQSLVEQLLTLARAGNINTTFADKAAPIRIKSIIEQVIGLLIPIADNKNIELTVDLQSDGKADIDETSLFMLIKNLIQNAIVYTPAGGQVVVKLCPLKSLLDSLDNFDSFGINPQYHFGSHVIRSGRLSRSKALDNKIVLQIIDSGKGIHPSDYEKVFEPFVRLNQQSTPAEQPDDSINTARSDSASKPSQQVAGTGLGLSIVKSICEQAGIDVFFKDAASIISNQNHRGLCITLVI